MAARRAEAGWAIELDSAFDCPDFTISLPVAESIEQVAHHLEGAATRWLSKDESRHGLLPAHAWRQDGDRVSLCFDLRRGRQVVYLQRGAE
jgi:hypothetical protein